MSSDHTDPASGHPPEPQPPMALPARRPRPDYDRYREPPPRSNGFGRAILVLLLLASLALNLGLCCLAVSGLRLFKMAGAEDDFATQIYEKHWSGNPDSHDKVAVIRIEGMLVDEMMAYAHKQIDTAAKDSDVKAVVVRINSPGGTITASDEIYKRLTELRDGSSPRYSNTAKPLVVSMGSMAASGGYYVAMPGKYIFAEKTTITGSIGVYAQFFNVAELGEKYGVKFDLVKAGEIKDAGSPFHLMKPEEREMWQEMIDNAFSQFMSVVERRANPGQGDSLSPQTRRRRHLRRLGSEAVWIDRRNRLPRRCDQKGGGPSKPLGLPGRRL